MSEILYKCMALRRENVEGRREKRFSSTFSLLPSAFSLYYCAYAAWLFF
jgi:hypothetical protein